MKLSTAIRLGIYQSPRQCKLFVWGDATCALGAAYAGLFGELPWGSMRARLHEMEKKLGYSWERQVDGYHLDQLVIKLNDDKEWSREDIARYLEGKGL